jgi:glutamate---cysteine ligase / carboxylate-amine ligase
VSDTRSYSIGMEEEYFVFDARSRRAIVRANKRFLVRARQRLGSHVMTEMLQSQIEVATPPCRTMHEAREHLTAFRTALAEEAPKQGLGIAALGTFPLAFWSEQTVTPKARYDAIMDDLQMVGMRNMLCGMHVHVAVPDPSTRVALMMRLVPYLPLLLALSTSSPFWQGHLTGLRGYRLAAYDELPRTGLPELFRTNAEYENFVSALVRAGIMPDASYIWWALRPSLRNPTLELRVADSCTRLPDAIAIAALFRCLVRALDRDPGRNADFDRVGRAITVENKWHAQRHGVAATFVEPFRQVAMSVSAWLDEVIELIAPDVEALGCSEDIAHLRTIVRDGTSADQQIRIFSATKEASRHRLTALKEVVDWAARETLQSATRNCPDARAAATLAATADQPLP